MTCGMTPWIAWYAGVFENEAEHDALAPPLVPLHVQLHGPEPVTDDALPALQRPDVGACESAVPLDEPHEPATGEDDGGVGVVESAPMRNVLRSDQAEAECLPVPPRLVNTVVASFPQTLVIAERPPGCIEM